MRVLEITQESPNYNPRTKSSPSPVFANIYQNTSTLTYIMYCHQGKAEWLCMVKLKILTTWLFIEKSSNPLLTQC